MTEYDKLVDRAISNNLSAEDRARLQELSKQRIAERVPTYEWDVKNFPSMRVEGNFKNK